MNENRINLNGAWCLGYAPNSKVVADNYNITTVLSLKASGYDIIPAEVPGNFELDLYKAGIIDDPYYSTNTLELQKYECMHMYYFMEFFLSEVSEHQCIHFEGIDTCADVYVNGVLVGSCENMFISHEFDLDCLHSGVNEILVHIKPVTIEARKYEISPASNAQTYNYDSLYIRKAGSMFGWDIMPRIVSGGIWRDVYIYTRQREYIKNVFAYTTSVDTANETASVIFHYNLAVEGDYIGDYSVKVSGSCGDSSFGVATRLWFTSGKIHCGINNCKFWWPRNYGDANLYDTIFELYHGDTLIDRYNFRFGVRTVKLDRTSTTDAEGNGQFRILINNKQIFAMGTNWVPVDAFHSNDVKRLPDIMPMLNDLGCNIVRCWGGNVYEHENFFDFCDENGIMIWQDFAMGCAVYPQEQEFLDILKPEIISIVKKYRNHASLCIWAGDNECDYAYYSWGAVIRNPNENIITRRLIPEILQAYDFTRPYLPSSPYIDDEAFKTGKPTSEEHCWGPRDYFKGNYYRNTVCHFASETGYHGCPSVESLKKYISPEKLWPWYDKEWGDTNEDWNTHAASMTAKGGNYSYRIPLMAKQIKTLFGTEPDNIEDFSIASQISQAEAKKYFIERFRFTKWRRTGIIWWNLIDGWPQISDAVVDYYYDKKLAYYYIKRSQQPLCMMADEDDSKIIFYIVNDIRNDVTVNYKITNITTGESVVTGTVDSKSDTSAKVCEHIKQDGEQCFYLIEWKYGKHSGSNHFMSGMPNIDLNAYRTALTKTGFEGIK